MRAKVVHVGVLVVVLAGGLAVGAVASEPTPGATPIPSRSRVYERVVASASCGEPIGLRRADGRTDDWPGRTGGVTGTGHYGGGQYLWTDYTHDDAGTGALVYPGEGELVQPAADGSVGTISPTLNRYGASAADVVELRFGADEAALHILAVTNFLNAPDTTVIAVGFDLDDSKATGVGTWPLGAGLTSPGVDLFVTAHPTTGGFCATVTSASGSSSLEDVGGSAAVDTETNAIELSVPRALLGASMTPRVVVGSGLWNAATSTWKRPVKGAKNVMVPEAIRAGEVDDIRGGLTDTDPGVLNLLFRSDEPMLDTGNGADAAKDGHKRAFEYTRQAETLQTGTTGPYSLSLDLARVLPGAPGDPAPTRRGDLVEFTRQYASSADLEGILWFENDITRDAIYLGARQSYAVHLPPCLAGGETACPPSGVPLSVSFHGGSGSHINQLEDMGPDVAAPMAARAQVLTIAPFGRGRRAPWWRGLGELDVLEAMADAERAYPVDPDRRIANGGSLGGYATLRFSALYPDLWAGAGAFCPATYENSTSTRELGNEVPATQQFTVFPLLGSLVNTPVLQVSGTIDPLVRIGNGRALRDALLGHGLDLRYTEWVNGHHCTWVPETSQRFLDWHVPEMLTILARGRTQHPAVVQYTVDPRHLEPGSEYLGIANIADVGVRHDRAWWVSQIRMRPDAIAAGRPGGVDLAGNTLAGPGDDVVGRVRATSHMLDGWTRSAESCGDEAGLAGVSGNREVEQTPGGASGITYPDPHLFRCQRQLRSTPAREPLLELAVTKLSELRIDTAAAGVPGAFVLRATGDGPVTVRLTAPAPGSDAWKPGLPGQPPRPAMRAVGGCVTSQRKVGLDLQLELMLGVTPCTVTIS